MGVSMFKHVVAISRSTLCIFVLLSLPVRWEKAEVSTSQGNFGRVWDMKFQCQCEQVWSVLESAHCIHFPYWCARLLFKHETLSWRHLQHHSCGCKHPKLGACAHEHHNFCWLAIEGVILFGLCGTIMTWYLLEPVLTNPHEWYTRTWFIGSLLLCKTRPPARNQRSNFVHWRVINKTMRGEWKSAGSCGLTILRAAKCETHATLGLTENRVLIPLNPMLYHCYLSCLLSLNWPRHTQVLRRKLMVVWLKSFASAAEEQRIVAFRRAWWHFWRRWGERWDTIVEWCWMFELL